LTPIPAFAYNFLRHTYYLTTSREEEDSDKEDNDENEDDKKDDNSEDSDEKNIKYSIPADPDIPLKLLVILN